jgi:hypothetical protein
MRYATAHFLSVPPEGSGLGGKRAQRTNEMTPFET